MDKDIEKLIKELGGEIVTIDSTDKGTSINPGGFVVSGTKIKADDLLDANNKILPYSEVLKKIEVSLEEYEWAVRKAKELLGQ